MKHRLNSINAYNKIKNNGLLSRRQQEVLDTIHANGGSTQNEATRILLGIHPNSQKDSFAPRFSELHKMGVIEIVGTKPDVVSGNTTDIYALTGNLPTKLPKPVTSKDKLNIALKLLKGYQGGLEAYNDRIEALGGET